jgi:hypothetical protein
MLSVIKTPVGHKLTDAELDATVTDSSGEALFTTAFAHGLTDGDYVYIQSNIESYNGFKYVDQTAYNTFKIQNTETSAAVAYKQDADVVYKISVLQHGFQCVHLPIVYELESDLYPFNSDEEAYTPRNVVSQSEQEGYTKLQLSTALNEPDALNWIEIVGTGPLAGVYQITEKLQPWEVVIDLAYSASNSFTGYTIVTYYNNYCVNVRVYAGLPVGHRWEDEKPYELAATLQLVPDDNNHILFSINEILRGFINLRNNLTLDTLPNNIDFITSFYITYWESYDISDGTEITTFEGDETIDGFEGIAVNAKLPFKTETISHLSDYLNEDAYLAQWLTIQTSPIAIVGRFFDLSFLLQISGVNVEITQNGVVIQTIVNPGLGVIRVPLEFDTAGEYCIQAGTVAVPPSTVVDFPTFASWTNSGAGTNWTTGATPSITVPATSSAYLKVDYAFQEGYTYEITIEYTKTYNSGSSNPRTITLFALDGSNNVIYSQSASTPVSPGGTGSVTLSFVASILTTAAAVNVNDGSNVDFELDSLTVTAEIDGITITEEICITALEECDDTIIEDDNIRLLEDGDFRILE